MAGPQEKNTKNEHFPKEHCHEKGPASIFPILGHYIDLLISRPIVTIVIHNSAIGADPGFGEGGGIRGGSRRGSLGGGTHTGRGATVILGLFLVFVKPIFSEVKGGHVPPRPPPLDPRLGMV